MRSRCLAFLLLCVTASGFSLAQTNTPHRFAVEGSHFALDGKPFQVISGEMHYPRIPREYWRDRLRMASAMGLNTITTYVFWNVHEPRPGVYDFSGNNDVAEFIREAQQEGLYVILRPGPYVCAEWEFGGYPAWLLKDHATKSSAPPTRSSWSPRAAGSSRLGKELAPLQIGNGGPIILVQVENEYGSFGNDHAYMEQIHQDARRRRLHASRSSTPPTAPTRFPTARSPNFPSASTSVPDEGAAQGLHHAEEAPPQRPLHEQRILGRLVRSLGRQARAHQHRSSKPRISTGCSSRATPSASTCFTAAPASAG